MKKSLLFLLISSFTAVYAQFPLVSIEDIQFRDEASLAGEDDLSLYNGDTVTVQGIVTFDPCTYALSTSGSRMGTFVVDQDNVGGWTGLHVLIDPGASGFGGTLEDLNDATLFVDNFQIGNVVEFTGIVGTFDGFTQIVLLDEPSSIIGFSSVPDPWVTTIDTFMMNDGAGGQVMQTITGEQYEGVFVEFQNVFVVDVSPFGDFRWNWSLQDADGNKIQIRDMSGFIRNDTNTDDECAIWSGGAAGETATPDEFEPPTTGTYLEYVRGTIVEAFGGGTAYALAIHTLDDIGPSLVSPPTVSGISNSTVVPTPSENVTISATITDIDGTVASAAVFYSFGFGSTAFTEVAMSNTGGDTWEGVIPGPGTDGEIVNYYIVATDDGGNAIETPASVSPLTYQVWADGITSIAQIQETPFTNGSSIWSGKTVPTDIEAIVMATSQTYDLSFVTVQDGEGPWSGIAIRSQPGDGTADLHRGDKIRITSGKVFEDFSFTRLDSISFEFISQANPLYNAVTGLDPLDIDAKVLDVAEAYEGMLLRFEDVFVTSNNADAPSTFGEWRFGSDDTPDQGLRVNDISYEVPFEFGTDSVVVGDPLGFIQGILTYSFSNFKLEPRDLNDIDGFSTTYPNSITAFNLPLPGGSVNGIIDQTALTISLTVADGEASEVSSIAPEVIFTGQYVDPDPSIEQDFSTGSPIEYTTYAPVTFEAKTYTVQVSFVAGIDADNAQNQLEVFPNPVSDNLTVVFTANESAETFIKVVDAVGHNVLESNVLSTVGKNFVTLDLRGLPNGLYLLHVQTGETVNIQKIKVSK